VLNRYEIDKVTAGQRLDLNLERGCLVTMAGLRSELLGRFSLRPSLKLPRLYSRNAIPDILFLVYLNLLCGT